jgi:predicted enzyme related to lactoylglutathione lyase
VTVLRKIDCVMLRVADLDAAAAFYGRVFGLRPLWRDATSIGMGLPETDAEIVLHTMAGLPEVHYLVDDVRAAVATYRAAGCRVRVEPFEIAIGWCAVLEDPDGNAVAVLDMTTGPRR